MQAKRKWILVVLMFSAAFVTQASGAAPIMTDFARNVDGHFLRMRQYEADGYCRAQGLRLPTARELALYSQSLGAEGIRETEKAGYYFVGGKDSVGNPDIFYFKLGNNYIPPAEALGCEIDWLWSSSPSGTDVDGHEYYYALEVRTGLVEGGYDRNIDYSSLTRCVVSH